jgi:hypothetical protein
MARNMLKDVAGVMARNMLKDVAGVMARNMLKDVAGVMARNMLKDVAGLNWILSFCSEVHFTHPFMNPNITSGCLFWSS